MKQTLILGFLAALGACGPLNDGNLGLDAARQLGSLVGIEAAPETPTVPPNIANAQRRGPFGQSPNQRTDDHMDQPG